MRDATNLLPSRAFTTPEPTPDTSKPPATEISRGSRFRPSLTRQSRSGETSQTINPVKSLSPDRPLIDAAGALAFLVMVAFWWGTPSAATIPRWAVIALTPLLLLWIPRRHWTLPHLVGLCGLGWAALSLTWTAAIYDGALQLAKFVFLAAAFGLGHRLSSLRNVYIGAALGISVSSLVVLVELYHPNLIQPHMMDKAGLFINTNVMAETAALVVIGLIGSKLWRFLPGALPAFVVPMGRGASIAVGVSLFVWLWTKSRRIALGVAVVLAGLVLTITAYKLTSTSQRLDLLLDNLNCLRTSWNSGLGSYDQIFPYCGHRIDIFLARVGYAHNDYIQLLIDLGPGAFLFFALFGICLVGPLTTEHFVLLAFMTEALFGFPSYMASTSFLGAIVLGHLCRQWDGIRPRDYAGRMVHAWGKLRRGLQR